ncbi:MAG: homoserine O-succinyltransferase [Planctomycetes bacterium]|nr:homoserine O-succinyltransferase [Planctomycetota bacterium]
MSPATTLGAGAGLLHLSTPFTLEQGGTLRGGVLAYSWYGTPDRPVVVVLGGISAGRHVSACGTDAARGWWEEQVGPGRAIDTRRWAVLGIDWLGGAGASSGPASHDPGGARFPLVSSADQARALGLLLDHLGVATVHGVVGASFGGMVALHLAAQRPRSVARLILLGAAHRSHPLASAWRAVQRGIVELGLRSGAARDGVALARGLAMTTYRTAEEFRERFADPPRADGLEVRSPVQEYLAARGAAFAAACDAHAFLRLNQAIDLHRIDPATVTAPATIVGFSGDQLVPPGDVAELARLYGGRHRLVCLATRFGHDAFLKETEAVAALLREGLHGTERTP